MSKPILCPEPRPWRGVIETDETMFGAAVAPPARKDYLAALWSLVLAANTQPYAITLLTFDAADAAGASGTWHGVVVYPPGCKYLRPWVTQGIETNDPTGSPPADATVETDEDGFYVVLPTEHADAQGGLVFPIGFDSRILSGAEAVDDAPSSDGDERMANIDEALIRGVSLCAMDNCHALGGVVRRSADLGAL